MHFSVAYNTKENTCENIYFIFLYPFRKNDSFFAVKKKKKWGKIYMRFLWGYYVSFTSLLLLWKLWDEPVA